MRFSKLVAGVASLAGVASAAVRQLPNPTTCSGVPAAHFPAMTVADGWHVMKLLGGLRGVRTIVWDPVGNMLVSQAGKGISVHTFGTDGCVNSTTMLVSNVALNHGLALTPDGKTLYASSERSAFSWTYDPATMKVSNQKTAIGGMDSGIHSTRNLLVVPTNPNLVLLQVGSNANFDMAAADKATGRAIVKVFDMSKAPASGYNYKADGEVFGYGMRNEIGFTADPNGHVWGVENSGDDFTRTVSGRRADIHKDNPAEKLNFRECLSNFESLPYSSDRPQSATPLRSAIPGSATPSASPSGTPLPSPTTRPSRPAATLCWRPTRASVTSPATPRPRHRA